MPLPARDEVALLDAIMDKSEPVPWSGCRIWTAGVDADGYGQTWFKGKNVRAHRMSWILNVGPIPAGMCVMHQCDEPSCVNPAHLRLGTNAENTADKMRKGRHRVAAGDSHYMRRNPLLRSGDKAAGARIKEHDVIALRERAARGERQKDLAKEFGITRSAVSAIVVRRNWKHL